MDANEYQREALVTAGQDENTRPMYTALGLAGEAGEIADLTKKWLYHNHPYDARKFLDELGDLQWYLAMSAKAHGFTLEEVMTSNIQKLRERYPNGFTSERSINRKR